MTDISKFGVLYFSDMTGSSRLVNKEQSSLHISTLEDEHTRQCLTSLRQLFSSSFGPNGSVQMLHNNIGGPVTLTSCAGRLVNALSVHNALARVVTTALQSHLLQCSDGGLFCGTFSLLLVERSLKLNTHRHLLCDIYESLLQECLTCLTQPEFNARSTIDFSSVKMPLNYIKSVIYAKCISCGLALEDVDHFAQMIMKTFLVSYFPKENRTSIQYLTLEGPPAGDSKLFEGILFQMPSIPIHKKDPISVKYCSDASENKHVRIALVSVSMSGDSEEFSDATYEVVHMRDLAETVVEEMGRFVEKLIHLQIGLLACQRVLHPRLKRKLRESGVYVIDRIGATHIEALQKLSGKFSTFSFTQ